MVAKTAPVVVDLLAKRDVSRTEADELLIVKQLVQVGYDSITPSSAASVALDIMKLMP